MECSAETIQLLDDLQAIDFTILNLKRTFENLPQRQAILKARQTMADLRDRLASAQELVDKAQARVDALRADQEALADKIAASKAALADKATGYRDVEARTKELASLEKRAETLEHHGNSLTAELDKVVAVRDKIAAALLSVEATEAKEVASFKEQGTDLQKRIAAAQAERARFIEQVDADTLAMYDKAAAKCGGVAVAHLNGATCSVCRSVIDEARLHQCRREAPLSVCPHCRRLLIIG